MAKPEPSTKMPELLIFGKSLVLGGMVAELFRVAYIGGTGFAAMVDGYAVWVRFFGIILFAGILLWYSICRDVVNTWFRLYRSMRVDLLIVMGLGAWATNISEPLLKKFHGSVSKVDPRWVLFFFVLVFSVFVFAQIRSLLSKRKRRNSQLYFLTDDEIDQDADDFLANGDSAIQFARAVLESSSNGGLVYGIDGPWGVGKTSFVNLASNYWRKNAANEVIIVRFEPLRYASDPDLAERMIRDFSSEIQSQVFVPEFRTAASRYSRMLKGKADFSFMGFNLSLEPSPETVDELLDDIDDVLKRINFRLIVVVDDLDRLDAKAINDVLFTVRRTFRLKQAAYILCYDTENLVSNKEEGTRAREFLEKFVNIKLSLFVDVAALRKFLRTDWSHDGDKFPLIPSDTMFKISSVLGELDLILESDENAATYLRLIGDMRKVKRFVNAILMMQIEKTDLARTDFNRRDLINLVLLHLNYPGLFRKIYAEETDGRSGQFSIRTSREGERHEYVNSTDFTELFAVHDGLDGFLLKQLFEVQTLNLGSHDSVEESVRASRACFNRAPNRNLESYLKLIVRFITPELRETFRLYQDAVASVASGEKIVKVLSVHEFDFDKSNSAHDEFWRILVSQSRGFTASVADDSIDSLVEFIPRYSLIDIGERGLRTRSIYNLIRLLDQAGWGRTNGRRKANTPQNIVEIAYRIFGEQGYVGRGLIDRLGDSGRGVLGIYDLLLFRLQCCADRLGQVYNLHGALIVYQDMSAATAGLLSSLAKFGMRTISQRVFALFRVRYIETSVNIFDMIDAVTGRDFLGDSFEYYVSEAEKTGESTKLSESIEATRSMIKSFIIFQLWNRQAATGSGVGCGFYDVEGPANRGGISTRMNSYLFDVCFNPELDARNAEHFLDYCLMNLTSAAWSDDEEGGYRPSVQGFISVMDAHELAAYWAKFGATIQAFDFVSSNKQITTLNYFATYADDLPGVFVVLNQIRDEHQVGQIVEVVQSS